METGVKIVTMIIGGAIAIELLTSQNFGSNVGKISTGFASILNAMRGTNAPSPVVGASG